jgi:hypothetical protein
VIIPEKRLINKSRLRSLLHQHVCPEPTQCVRWWNF